MKRLLIATALIEVGAGAALMSYPSAMAMLLVGAPLAAPAALRLVRVGAAGVLALGVACWLARDDAQSRAARGLVIGMLLYNVGAVVILGSAGIQAQPVGAALWLAVVLHATMAGWCIADLSTKPALSTDLD